MKRIYSLTLASTLAMAAGLGAFQGTGGNRLTPDVFRGLELRSLGPSLTTGRVADIEVDPQHPNVYYVVAAAGGLWKSENRGNDWTPMFDEGGAFNMSCLAIDPKNTNILWLGTGENSNPRSAMIGDGLYKSTDAGKTWRRVGLENSEHIGNIQIDPRNSNVVYVAAQGPLWSAGGDRGIYKTTDGGTTWKAVLTVSPDTGGNEVWIDPNNPDVLYASTWQRRRGVGQMIGGGRESGIYKSTNAGNTWTKLSNGLPKGDMGRAALGVDPKAKPTRVYALINALAPDSGFSSSMRWRRIQGSSVRTTQVRRGSGWARRTASPAVRRLRRPTTRPRRDARAAAPAHRDAAVAAADAAAPRARTAAATPATTRRSTSIRSDPTRSGRRTRTSSGAVTAASPGTACRTSTACTWTSMTCGPIPKI
jgi:hypothetical protein